jgi:hypothetical protein
MAGDFIQARKSSGKASFCVVMRVLRHDNNLKEHWFRPIPAPQSFAERLPRRNWLTFHTPGASAGLRSSQDKERLITSTPQIPATLGIYTHDIHAVMAEIAIRHITTSFRLEESSGVPDHRGPRSRIRVKLAAK